MEKLQFLIMIFAVLLPNLCNVLLFNYVIYLSSLSILNIATVRHIRWSKIKNVNFTSGAGDQQASSCQILSKTVKYLQRYCNLTVFKMAAVRHFGFLNLKFLTVVDVIFCITVPNFVIIGQTFAEIYRFFVVFKMAATAILVSERIRNFNGRSTVTDQYASLCQNSSKSVKRSPTYGDLTVFKMAPIRHLGFWKFNFLTVKAIKNRILHHYTKLRKDRSNRCGYIAIPVIFKMAAAAILDLLGGYWDHLR